MLFVVEINNLLITDPIFFPFFFSVCNWLNVKTANHALKGPIRSQRGFCNVFPVFSVAMLIHSLLNVHRILKIKPREALSHSFTQLHPTFLQALGAGLQNWWWHENNDKISKLNRLSLPKCHDNRVTPMH